MLMQSHAPPSSADTAALVEAPDRHVAAAVLVVEDGRYLLQLRDPFPHIHLPDHWALFGGGIEAGEDPEAAIRREIEEELGWTAREVRPLAVSVHAVWPAARPWRMHFFVLPFQLAEQARMVLGEGAAMGLFSLPEILALDRIAPWDLCAILMHARAATLFPTPRET